MSLNLDKCSRVFFAAVVAVVSCIFFLTSAGSAPTRISTPSGEVSGKIKVSLTISPALVRKAKWSRYYIDNQQIGTTDRKPPFAFNLDTSILDDGDHTIKVVTEIVGKPSKAKKSSVSAQARATRTVATRTITVRNRIRDKTVPTPASGLAVRDVTKTSAVLTWKAATDNVGVTRNVAKLSNGYTVSVAGSAISATLPGRTCGTSYTATVSSFDAAGNVSTSSPLTFSTAACAVTDTSAPSAPSGLVSSSVTQTSATLSWNASADNVGVTGYRVFKGGVLQAGIVPGTSTSVVLSCGVSASFTVKASDAAGNESAFSSALQISGTACSPGPDVTPPSAPANLVFSNVTNTSATLSWTASTDNDVVASYDIYRNGVWIDWTLDAPYTYTGLSCGTTYTAMVIALDPANNIGASQNLSFTTAPCVAADSTAPTVPSELASSSITQSSATLSWNSSTDAVGVTGYKIYKGGVFVKSVASGTSTSVALTCGASSSFAVTAYDAVGNESAASGSLSITGSSCPVSDTTAPSTPTDLIFSSITQTSATLSWTASTDNVGVDHYTVFKDGISQGNASGTSKYVALTCGAVTSFTVRAYDAAGNTSTASSAGTVTASACSGSVTPPSLPGVWSLDFSDEFNGSSLDNKWCSSWWGGGVMNNVNTSASNVSVSGGDMIMTLASSNSGALINTNPGDCGKAGYTFTTGYYAEARIYFPGNGTTLYNWPAWWTAGQNWPTNGEIDIAEGLGPMSSNFHSDSGANNFFPSGIWTNAYHTYAVLRESGRNYIYFDGLLIRDYATDDNGSPHHLIFNVGRLGSSPVYGTGSQVKTDWVRVWKKN